MEKASKIYLQSRKKRKKQDGVPRVENVVEKRRKTLERNMKMSPKKSRNTKPLQRTPQKMQKPRGKKLVRAWLKWVLW